MMMMMVIKTREHIDIKNPRWSPVLTMQICECSSLEFAEVEHIERENKKVVSVSKVLMMVERVPTMVTVVVVLMESYTIDYVKKKMVSMEKERMTMMMIGDRSVETFLSRCCCYC
jgi:hypothetical protein